MAATWPATPPSTSKRPAHRHAGHGRAAGLRRTGPVGRSKLTSAAEILPAWTGGDRPAARRRWSQTPGVHQVRRRAVDLAETHLERPTAPNLNMGITVGENTAEQCGVTREEADQLGHVVEPPGRGRHRRRPVRRGDPCSPSFNDTLSSTTRSPSRNASLEKLASLPTVFQEGGVVSARLLVVAQRRGLRRRRRRRGLSPPPTAHGG